MSTIFDSLDKNFKMPTGPLPKDEVLTLVPVSALKILNEYFGDFDSWLDSKIEQAVYTLKN